MKKILFLLLTLFTIFFLSSCGGKREDESDNKISITIYAAKSLGSVVDDLIETYGEEHPEVEILTNYDGSGTLMEQIREGADCDIFFPAAQKQMDLLQEEGKIDPSSRKNVVNNQVCVVTYKGSNTRVKGLSNLNEAENIAMADGSVPVGKYTRQALVNLGILAKAEDVSQISSEDISKALGGVEINECSNVGAVAAAVTQGANEVGTVYKSDTRGFEDQLEILEVIPYDLTGDVIYPVALVNNEEAEQHQQEAARDFLAFLTSQEAETYYKKYYFDTNVE